MTPPRKQFAAVALLALSSLASLAQTPPQPKAPPQTPPSQPAPIAPRPTRTLILIDPAHGGPDTGAHLHNSLLEKDLTLAFNNRLRALLSAAAFAVISTRTSDPAAAFTADQRAEIANHDHPALCLLLHATGSGSGIHLFTSTLTPVAQPPHILHWNTAQAASVPSSRALANKIGAALLASKLPVIVGQATVPPLDNLTCPAIAIELAPLSGTSTVSDSDYQQHVAEAIVSALTQWRADNTAENAAADAAPGAAQ